MTDTLRERPAPGSCGVSDVEMTPRGRRTKATGEWTGDTVRVVKRAAERHVKLVGAGVPVRRTPHPSARLEEPSDGGLSTQWGAKTHYTSGDVCYTQELPFRAECTYLPDFKIAVTDARAHACPDAMVLSVPAEDQDNVCDTGAGPSVISVEALRNMPEGARMVTKHEKARRGPRGADGEHLLVLGQCELTFHLGGRLWNHSFMIIPGPATILLGIDFLIAKRAEILMSTDGVGPNGMLRLRHEPQRRGGVLRTVDVPICGVRGGAVKAAAARDGDERSELSGDVISARRRRAAAVHGLDWELCGDGSWAERVPEEILGRPDEGGLLPRALEEALGLAPQRGRVASAAPALDIAASDFRDLVSTELFNRDVSKTATFVEVRAEKQYEGYSDIDACRLAALEAERAMGVPSPTEAPQPEPDEMPTVSENVTSVDVEREHLLYSHHPITLPPRSVAAGHDGRTTVYLRVPRSLALSRQVMFVDRLPERSGLDVHSAVACQFVEPEGCENGDPDVAFVPVTLINVSPRSKTIPTSTPVAILSSSWEEVRRGVLSTEDLGARPWERLSAEMRKLLEEVKVDPDRNLTEAQRARIMDLLAEFSDCFALNAKQPAHTHVTEVLLPLLPGSTAARFPPAKYGEAGRLIVDKEVAELEANGIIRKSNSAWGARVVLAAKKGEDGTPGGATRFCIDYRQLNSKLVVEDTPIPRCDEALDRLASGKGRMDSLYLSTLDLASGFYTLPIAEEHKHRTAFTTHRGKYEWNYLPFGVQSGPSYMCNLMDAALQGLAWEICMPYLDDVGIWSTGLGDTQEERDESSFEQMMERMRLVFERMRWAGLTCKAKKCVLCATDTDYLGHRMGRKGLSMDPKKLTAVAGIEPTEINTLDRVRSFLGLTGYYRKFIKGYPIIAAPLTELTKKGVNVGVMSQLPRVQAAITKLIGAMTDEKIFLATPRYDRKFIVKTDGASTEGIGGVLVQLDDDGRERVVAYYGRRLTPAESNWTVTEIELLAALRSIENWRGYLWGREFELVTDHAALRWLHSMKDSISGGAASRLMRWIIKLQEYRFSVTHKAGADHGDADGVSRLVECVRAVRSRGSKGSATGAAAIQQWLRDKRPSHEEIMQVFELCVAASPEQQVRAVRGSPPVEAELGAKAPVETAELQRDRAREAIDAAAAGTAVSTAHLPVPTEGLLDAQRIDPECIAFRSYLLTGMSRPTIDSHLHSFEASSVKRRCHRVTMDRTGLLVKRVQVLETPRQLEARLAASGWTASAEPLPAETRDLPMVPESLREAYMRGYHEMSCHGGIDGTQKLMSQRVWWPSISRDIRDWIKNCHQCTLGKQHATNAQPARPRLGKYPFDLIVCDVLSMCESRNGFTKLVLFIDSLTRWIEAIPVRGEPTSAEFLDLFMWHVVCRHGAPRGIVCDDANNLGSQLCQEVLSQTGVNLRQSTAEHHETAGSAERANKTIVDLLRCTNEGGSRWDEELPFALLWMRSTPNRLTRRSPSRMLYGREVRQPMQLLEPSQCPDGLRLLADGEVGYADRLRDLLIGTWAEGLERSVAAQDLYVSTASQTKNTVTSFAVGDHVCRHLPGKHNKLSFHWWGPYRVGEVLENGNYRLRDLENKMVSDVVNVARLRPYFADVQIEDVQPDEYVVDYVFDRRYMSKQRQWQYLTKFRNYPKSKAEWTDETELRRRCSDLLDEYDAKRPRQPPNAARAGKPRTQRSPLGDLTNVRPDEDRREPAGTEAHLVDSMRYAKGEALYRIRTQARRGRGYHVRWRAASFFSDKVLASAEFVAVREAARLAGEYGPDDRADGPAPGILSTNAAVKLAKFVTTPPALGSDAGGGPDCAVVGNERASRAEDPAPRSRAFLLLYDSATGDIACEMGGHQPRPWVLQLSEYAGDEGRGNEVLGHVMRRLSTDCVSHISGHLTELVATHPFGHCDRRKAPMN